MVDFWDLGVERDKGSRTSLFNLCDERQDRFTDDLAKWPHLYEYPPCICGKGLHDFQYFRTPLLYKKEDRVEAFYGIKYDTNVYGLMPLGWSPHDKKDYLTILCKVVEPLGETVKA